MPNYLLWKDGCGHKFHSATDRCSTTVCLKADNRIDSYLVHWSNTEALDTCKWFSADIVLTFSMSYSQSSLSVRFHTVCPTL